MRQANLEADFPLLASAGASVASGQLSGLARPLRLRARTERRRNQQSEGVDTLACMVAGARGSMQEQRCAGKEGARWRACCAARWPIMMDKAANISMKVSGSMGMKCAAHSHLRRGVRAAVSFTRCVVGVQVAQNRVAGHDRWWKGGPRSHLPRGSPL